MEGTSTPDMPPPPSWPEPSPGPDAVPPSSAKRSRRPMVIAMAATTAIVIGAAAAFAAFASSRSGPPSRPGFFHSHGFAFSYPATWTAYPGPRLRYNAGAAPASSDALAITRNDFVVLATYRLNRAVGPRDLDELRSEFTTLAGDLAAQAGGRVESGPENTVVAGMPGLRFRISVTEGGAPGENRILVLFEDTTELLVNCQHTPEYAAQIERGCDQIEATLRPD